MACKILGSHPRIELQPPTSNVLTTGLPGKPLFSIFNRPEGKYFRLHSHCHIFYSFFLQVFNKVKTALFHPQAPCAVQKQACVWFAEPWPKQIELSAGDLAPMGHVKFTGGSRSSCLGQNYDLIIHKHGFYTTGILYPVYLCLYPLNETYHDLSSQELTVPFQTKLKCCLLQEVFPDS